MLDVFYDPQKAMRLQYDRGITDSANTALLLSFAIVNYFAQLPALYVTFQNGPQNGISFADMAGWFAVWSIFGVALLMYGLSGIAHFFVKRGKNKISGAQARRAMFWAANMSLPLIVVNAVIMALQLSNLAAILGFMTFGYFLWYWQAAWNALGSQHV